MNKTKIVKAFYLFLSCFPFLLATIYSFICLFCKNLQSDYNTRLITGDLNIISVLLLLLLICIILIIYYFVKKHINQKEILCLIILFIVFIPRFSLFLLYHNNIALFSDFLYSYQRAIGNWKSLAYYKFFPGYINFSLLMKVILKLLHTHDYRCFIIINIILNSFTAIGIFFLGEKTLKSKYYAFLAAIIYGLYPPAIYYCLTCTPEHIAICCNIFAILIIMHCLFEMNINKNKGIICSILSGIVFGIGSSVKTFFPIIFIALILSFVIFYIVSKEKPKFLIIKMGLFILLIFVGEQIILHSITKLSEKYFKVSLDWSDATPHYFFVGLNRQGEGQIHLGNLSRKYISLRTEGVTRDKAITITKQLIWDDWNTNKEKIWFFINKKNSWAWQDDNIPIFYFICQIISPKEIENNLIANNFYFFTTTFIRPCSELSYFLLMLLGLISCIYKVMNSNINIYSFLLDLIIAGYFCLIFLSEGQSRYKCLIIPLIIIHSISFFSYYNYKTYNND